MDDKQKAITDIKNIVKRDNGDGLVYIFKHENGNYYPLFLTNEQSKALFDVMMTFDKINSDYTAITYVLSEQDFDRVLEMAFMKGMISQGEKFLEPITKNHTQRKSGAK